MRACFRHKCPRTAVGPKHSCFSYQTSHHRALRTRARGAPFSPFHFLKQATLFLSFSLHLSLPPRPLLPLPPPPSLPASHPSVKRKGRGCYHPLPFKSTKGACFPLPSFDQEFKYLGIVAAISFQFYHLGLQST